MDIKLLTLFPSFFESPFSCGIISAAVKSSNINIHIVNLRDYGDGNYKKCDDYPYGGGPGLILTTTIFKKYFDENKKNYTIMFSPTGYKLTQGYIKKISMKENVTFILGHYEGIDKRVEELYVNDIISVGDYVLSGGEIPALLLIDAISRYKGGLKNNISVSNDTFEENTYGFLEYDQYTRPKEIENIKVPDVLTLGNHKDIKNYRRKSSILKTFNYRPDLLKNVSLNEEDILNIFNYLIEKSKYNDKSLNKL